MSNPSADGASDSSQSVARALKFIESRLDQLLTVREIAKEAGLSSFYFQRVFVASLGESVTDYIRRRRLERAATLLTSMPNQTIIDIALECGF